MRNDIISITDIDAFVFDFDGVLTNNVVYLQQSGEESVCCSRADGLAFDLLRKMEKPAYILSTEQNPVVTARANKLKIKAIQGISNKVEGIKRLAKDNDYSLERIFYVGNDLNDYRIMRLCGYTACPLDSHEKIKEIAHYQLKTAGGNGVVREILEDLFKLDFIQILYPN